MNDQDVFFLVPNCAESIFRKSRSTEHDPLPSFALLEELFIFLNDVTGQRSESVTTKKWSAARSPAQPNIQSPCDVIFYCKRKIPQKKAGPAQMECPLVFPTPETRPHVSESSFVILLCHFS
jgi:hypothetical protein